MSVEKRMIIAVVVSAVIIIVWNLWIMPPTKPVPKDEATADEEDGEGETTEGEAEDRETEEPEVITADLPPEELPPENTFSKTPDTVYIDTDLYRVEVTTEAGGSATSWIIKNYEASFSDEELDLVTAAEYRTSYYEQTILPLATMLRSVEDKDACYRFLDKYPVIKADLAGDEVIFDSEGRASVKFLYNMPETGWIVKELTFQEDSYVVDIALTYSLEKDQGQPVVVWGPGIGELLKATEEKTEPGNEGLGYIHRAVGKGIDRKVFQIGRETGAGYPFYENEVKDYALWLGVENAYFLALAFTDPGNEFSPVYRLITDHKVGGGEEGQSFYFPYVAIKPSNPSKVAGGEKTGFQMYVGPKELERLEAAAGGRLKEVVQFGWFGFISRPGLWLLNQVNSFVGNYGWSIVLLTFLINTLLLPLMLKQRKSMMAMQRLQPQIKQIQAKYKADRGDSIEQRQARKKALNEELMALYKVEGVNPMGGCLPLLVQLPILIAFFDMLRVAIEIRKAPFIFWIDNLAAPDIWITLLMGVVMYAGQAVTPVTTDAGGGAMKFLPLIFVFLFISTGAASGLVLYWMTSSLYSLGTQLIFNATNPPPSPAGPSPAKKGQRSKKKSRRR